jgi:hypothetical protein
VNLRGFLLENDDYCVICSGSGNLLCCDGGCGRAFHYQCLGYSDLPVEDIWECDDCKYHRSYCFHCKTLIADADGGKRSDVGDDDDNDEKKDDQKNEAKDGNDEDEDDEEDEDEDEEDEDDDDDDGGQRRAKQQRKKRNSKKKMLLLKRRNREIGRGRGRSDQQNQRSSNTGIVYCQVRNCNRKFHTECYARSRTTLPFSSSSFPVSSDTVICNAHECVVCRQQADDNPIVVCFLCAAAVHARCAPTIAFPAQTSEGSSFFSFLFLLFLFLS